MHCYIEPIDGGNIAATGHADATITLVMTDAASKRDVSALLSVSNALELIDELNGALGDVVTHLAGRGITGTDGA